MIALSFWFHFPLLEKSMRMATITVVLNGSNQNPFERMGLRCNPFPQVGDYELMPLQSRLAELGGEPIKDEADLRKRLEGFTPGFIEGCINRYIPGQVVKFTITFPY